MAELEAFCSRPHAPTRRLALGRSVLPVDPAPGPGGVLLGGIVARFVRDLDEETIEDLDRLASEIERGRRIAQPRLRFRLQTDTIGLTGVTHRLVSRDDQLRFEFGERGAPAQHVLAAMYAAGGIDPAPRRTVMTAIRCGLHWPGPVGPGLIAALGGVRHGSGSFASIVDPRSWAMGRLGFPDPESTPSAREIQRRYRERLRDVHPDHGAADDGAAERIAELAEARRLLTGR